MASFSVTWNSTVLEDYSTSWPTHYFLCGRESWRATQSSKEFARRCGCKVGPAVQAHNFGYPCAAKHLNQLLENGFGRERPQLNHFRPLSAQFVDAKCMSMLTFWKGNLGHVSGVMGTHSPLWHLTTMATTAVVTDVSFHARPEEPIPNVCLSLAKAQMSFFAPPWQH